MYVKVKTETTVTIGLTLDEAKNILSDKGDAWEKFMDCLTDVLSDNGSLPDNV